MMRPFKVFLVLLLMVMGVELRADTTLEVKKKWGIPYISGGLNKGEAQFMDKIAPRFPVQLTFKNQGKEESIAGVQVRVFDMRGDLIFEEIATGPKMFLTIDNGRYTFKATYMSRELAFTKDLTGRRYLVLGFDFSVR